MDWLREMKETFGKTLFEFVVAMPRVRNNPNAYKDAEAALIHLFDKKYGSAPLKNGQFEYQKFGYEFS